MNKKTLLAVICMSLMLVPFVAAGNFWSNTKDRLQLVEKDADWNEVENGAYGELVFSTVSLRGNILYERIRGTVYGLEGRTKYQLIYYGNNETNDEWPYATCIGKEFKTGGNGQKRIKSTSFNHLAMFDDCVSQKFWVIKASDVDCSIGEMTSFNQLEYLFEHNTV